jgi:hypothetical protein
MSKKSDVQQEVEEILAQARAQAQAIIEAAKEEATKAYPRKARVVKVREEVVLTEEEQAERVEAERVKQARIAELKDELEQLTARITELKAELKVLTGKVGGAGATHRGPVGVGAFIKGLIQEGLTNEQIMERVAVEWPTNLTNTGCVNWYRNALKQWPDGKRPSRKVVTVNDDSATVEEEVEEEEVAEEDVENFTQD